MKPGNSRKCIHKIVSEALKTNSGGAAGHSSIVDSYVSFLLVPGNVSPSVSLSPVSNGYFKICQHPEELETLPAGVKPGTSHH